MRKPRINHPNSFYHIYNQGVNREIIFKDKEDIEYWVELLHEVSRKLNTHVYCFVTMQNHFHCLVETEEPNISQVLWHIGYYFARYINKKYGRVGHLFRNRCQSQIICNLEYLRIVVWYIHNNPIASGLIKHMTELHPMVYTSYHDLVGITNKYLWLAKSRLLKKLDILNPKKNHQLWDSIKRQDFADFTKIEVAYQKISGLI